MKHVFLTLSALSTAVLVTAFALGLAITDAAEPSPAVQRSVSVHFLVGLGALIFATLVHALVLTYFMGTGRWLEETCRAYKLPDDRPAESRGLKYRTIPLMVGALALLVLCGASGAMADPAAGPGRDAAASGPAASVHLWFSAVTVVLNAAINVREYRALGRNGEIIEEVMQDVRRIRINRGLPTEEE